MFDSLRACKNLNLKPFWFKLKIETFKDSPEDQEFTSDLETTSGCKIIDDPVCGTDDLNYPNECEAKYSNVEVAYKGECRDDSSSTEPEE